MTMTDNKKIRMLAPEDFRAHAAKIARKLGTSFPIDEYELSGRKGRHWLGKAREYIEGNLHILSRAGTDIDADTARPGFGTRRFHSVSIMYGAEEVFTYRDRSAQVLVPGPWQTELECIFSRVQGRPAGQTVPPLPTWVPACKIVPRA